MTSRGVAEGGLWLLWGLRLPGLLAGRALCPAQLQW